MTLCTHSYEKRKFWLWRMNYGIFFVRYISTNVCCTLLNKCEKHSETFYTQSFFSSSVWWSCVCVRVQCILYDKCIVTNPSIYRTTTQHTSENSTHNWQSRMLLLTTSRHTNTHLRILCLSRSPSFGYTNSLAHRQMCWLAGSVCLCVSTREGYTERTKKMEYTKLRVRECECAVGWAHNVRSAHGVCWLSAMFSFTIQFSYIQHTHRAPESSQYYQMFPRCFRALALCHCVCMMCVIRWVRHGSRPGMSVLSLSRSK